MKMDKSFHGYLLFPRQSRLLSMELGYELFGFYMLLVCEAVWHRGNKHFGQVVGTQVDLAKKLHMNQSTISRNLKKLEKHKYCVMRHEQEYIVLGFFPLFLKDVVSKIHSNNYATLNALYADVHRINAELQEGYANMQDKRSQKTYQSVYDSSNNYVSSSELNKDEINIDDIDEGIERARKGSS